MAANLLHERLPQNWHYGVTGDGRVFFLDDGKRRTTWLHPVSGKPIQTGHKSADLPSGFEEAVTPEEAVYFIDHHTETTSFELPSTRHLTKPQHHSPNTISQSHSPPNQISPTSPTRSRKGSTKQKSVKAPTAKRNSVVRPTQQGYLFRLESGDLKSWKRRWCVLSEFGLFFYKDYDEKRSTGSLLLPGYTIAPCTNTDYVGRQFAFKAEHENTTTEYLATDSQDDMERWMNTLNMAAQLKKDPRLEREMNNNNTNNYVQFNQGPLIPKSPFITRNGDDDDDNDPIPPPFAHKIYNPDYIHPSHNASRDNISTQQQYNNSDRERYPDNRGNPNTRDSYQDPRRSQSLDPYSQDVRRSQSSLEQHDPNWRRSQSLGPHSNDRRSYSSLDPRLQHNGKNQTALRPNSDVRRSYSSLDARSQEFPGNNNSLELNSQENRRSRSSLDRRFNDSVHNYNPHDSDSWRNSSPKYEREEYNPQSEHFQNQNFYPRDSVRSEGDDSLSRFPDHDVSRGPSGFKPNTGPTGSSSQLNHMDPRENLDSVDRQRVLNNSEGYYNSGSDIHRYSDNAMPHNSDREMRARNARQSLASTVSVSSDQRIRTENPYMYMSLPNGSHGDLSRSQSLPFSRSSYGDPRNSNSFSHPPDIIQPHSLRSSLAHDRSIPEKLSPDDIPEERSWKNPADRYLELKPQRYSRADSDIHLDKGQFSVSQSVPELHRIDGHRDDPRYMSQLIPPVRKESRNDWPDNVPHHRPGPDDPIHTYMNFPQKREDEWQNSGNSPNEPIRPPLPASMRLELAHHLALTKTPSSSEDIRRAAENERLRQHEKPFFRFPTPEVERKDGFPGGHREDPMKSSNSRSSYASDRNRPEHEERKSYNPLYITQPAENSRYGDSRDDSNMDVGVAKREKPVDRDRRRTLDDHQSLKPGDRERIITDTTNKNEGFYSPIQAERAHSMNSLHKPAGGSMSASGVDLNKSIESLIEGERTSAFTPLLTSKKASERKSSPYNVDASHQPSSNDGYMRDQPGMPQMASTPHYPQDDSHESLPRHDNYGIVPKQNYESESLPQRHPNEANTLPMNRYYDPQPTETAHANNNSRNPNMSDNYHRPPHGPYDTSDETEVKRFSTSSSQISNQSRGYPRDSRQPNYPAQHRGMPNTLGMHTVKEDPNMPDEAVLETRPNLGRKFPINGNRLRMSISAGDLIGKTHDELVLLLIQLRRDNSGVEKARDFYRDSLEKFRPGEHEYRKRLNESDHEVSEERLVRCHKQFVEMRNLCDDVEKKLEIYRPIINLVDNMVTMGSLYGGDNMMLATQYRKHLLRPDQYTPAKKMLEFSRQHQEDKFLNEMEEEIRKLTKDEVALESDLLNLLQTDVEESLSDKIELIGLLVACWEKLEKLERLFELDRGIQELSFKVNSCREDKDLLEKALQGILKQQDHNRNNPRELDKLVQQQRTIEKELSRVMHQLADFSKELEVVTAENNKVELDVTLLRSKVQSELSRSKSAPSLSGDGDRTKVKMERELAKVENIMAGLSQEGARLSEVMNNLRRSSSGAKYGPGLDEPKKKGGTYKETDLDSSNTRDLAVNKKDSMPSQSSSQKHKPAREYIPSKAQLVRSSSQKFEPKHAKVSYISRSQPNLQKASLVDAPVSQTLPPKKFGSLGHLNTDSHDGSAPYEEDQPPLPERRYGSEYTLMHQPGYADDNTQSRLQPSHLDPDDENQWDISEADDNTKRFYGLIPREKPKLLTVRDVKRQAEQRRERDKKKDELSADDNPDAPWLNTEEKPPERQPVRSESGYDSGLYNTPYHQRYPSDISDLYASARAEPYSLQYKDTDPVYENLPRLDPLRNISSVQFNPNSSAPSSRRSSIHLFAPKPFTPYQEAPVKKDDIETVVKSENLALHSENRAEPVNNVDMMNQYNSDISSNNDYNRNIHNYHIDLSQPNNYSIDVHSPDSYNNNFDSVNKFSSLTVTDGNNNSNDFDDKSPNNQPPWKQYSPPAEKKEQKERKSPRRRVGRYLTISSSEPIKLEVLSPRNRERHSEAGLLISSTQIDEIPDIVKSSTTRSENIDEYTFDSMMFLPQKVLIPERYDPSSDVEDLTEDEKQQRQEKAEKIKRLLAMQSVHSLSQPDISQLNKNPHLQAEQEKRMRAQLLSVGQELAKEVSKKTKEAAVKRRKTWSGTPALTDEQIYGSNNDDTINRALNVEDNYYIDDNHFL